MNKLSSKNNNFFDGNLCIITLKAMPKVLVKVLNAKNLIENENFSITNATKKIGISRTTYYKYANEVYSFNDIAKTDIIRLEILNVDRVGILSKITNKISNNKFNIIEISQNNPVNDMTKINVSIIKTNSTCNISKLVEEIKNIKFIKKVTIKSISKN